MQQNRPVRVIKRQERMRAETTTAEAPAEPQGALHQERRLKTVVAGWVREHKERSEEYQRMFTSLLRQTGFCPPKATSRA